jgi:ribosomal protein L7Ae-like RNA K-turn-binding protein
VAEKPVVTAEPVLGEPMDILTGLQLVLKKSLAHDGLARGLHEAAKAIEKHAAQLCVLAEDCNQPDYSKLVQALCSEHNVNLISVPSAKKLGEWVGVSHLIAGTLEYCVFTFHCTAIYGNVHFFLLRNRLQLAMVIDAS